jgi:phospholipase C
MVLILAKAAGCSWTTARELALMQAAKRNLTDDDLAIAFERYKKLERGAAQNIVKFFIKRLELRKLLDRAQTGAAKPAAAASKKKSAAGRAAHDGARARSPQFEPV